VVGGGPCGSFSALTASRLGVEVVVCEEHGEVGVPVHGPGHISIQGLKRLGLSLPRRVVENEFRGAVFYSPSGGEFRVKRRQYVTVTVNRKLFDQHLWRLALKAGARYLLNARVRKLLAGPGGVRGVLLNTGGRRVNVRSKLVIDAEGFPPTLLRGAKLPIPRPSMLVNAVHADVDHVDGVERDMVEVYLGRRYAPGFFAWIIPKRGGSAKVGLGALGGDPRRFLHRFMHRHPVASQRLGKGRITHLAYRPIPIGGPLTKTFFDGLLVVGDAASQVKPTTGGGIIFGMTCSRIAGEVAFEALVRNDFSEGFLSRYQRRWRRVIGFDLRVMGWIRRVLSSMSDGDLDKLIRLCSRLEVNKLLEEVGDVDFEGRSLIRMLPRKKALKTFIFLILHLLPSGLGRGFQPHVKL